MSLLMKCCIENVNKIEMKAAYIFNLVISLLILIGRIYDHDIQGALGWLCSATWLTILIIEEYRKDENKNN